MSSYVYFLLNTVTVLIIYFAFCLLNQKANWLKLGRKYHSDLQIKNKLKQFRSEIQDKKSLLNFFWIGRPFDSKLGRKYQGDLQIKIAKNVPIVNPRWPSWKSFLCFFWTKGQWTRNLIGSNVATCRSKIAATCRSKIAKTVSSRKSKMATMAPSWKSILALLLLNRKANWFEIW